MSNHFLSPKGHMSRELQLEVEQRLGHRIAIEDADKWNQNHLAA